jgi:5-methylcytosine-specific restriction endonuclease McrA
MKNIEKKCFSLIQQIVTLRDVVCQHCTDIPISGHHVWGRRNRSIAFEPDACIGLCMSCHDGWARRCPDEVKQLLKDKIGGFRYIALEELSSKYAGFREKDYMEIAIILGIMLSGMRGR